MDAVAKQRFIRRAATRAHPGGIVWSQHAVAKLALEDLARQAVEEALREGEIIEDYPPAHRPLPDCLILAHLSAGEPLHAVLAVDEPNDRLFVVTVYRPDPRRWTDDRRTRRR
jgi:hypothetical protein